VLPRKIPSPRIPPYMVICALDILPMNLILEETPLPGPAGPPLIEGFAVPQHPPLPRFVFLFSLHPPHLPDDFPYAEPILFYPASGPLLGMLGLYFPFSISRWSELIGISFFSLFFCLRLRPFLP